jgi:hypothetical protein
MTMVLAALAVAQFSWQRPVRPEMVVALPGKPATPDALNLSEKSCFSGRETA